MENILIGLQFSDIRFPSSVFQFPFTNYTLTYDNTYDTQN